MGSPLERDGFVARCPPQPRSATLEEVKRTEEMVADSIIRTDITVPDVYALLYGDEVDWDAELADLEAEDGIDVDVEVEAAWS
jgi:hypothetical protein